MWNLTLGLTTVENRMLGLKSKERKEMKFLTTPEVELALANHLNIRANIIVPNISWGLLPYEVDLLVVSSKGYATEIEIKVSASDLKADKLKKHNHSSHLIKRLFFALPLKLEPYLVHVPSKAGILLVDDYGRVREHRKAKLNTAARKLTEKEIYQVLRLGNMRTWTLRKKLLKSLS
jgi:hypothetical protein